MAIVRRTEHRWCDVHEANEDLADPGFCLAAWDEGSQPCRLAGVVLVEQYATGTGGGDDV